MAKPVGPPIANGSAIREHDTIAFQVVPGESMVPSWAWTPNLTFMVVPRGIQYQMLNVEKTTDSVQKGGEG